MTPQEIEFLPSADAGDPAAAPLGDAPPPAAASGRSGWAPLASVGAWAAAAVLATVAPFMTVYGVDYPDPSGDFTLDGWGRYAGQDLGPQFGSHGTRYGIALLLCAAALAVLAGVGALGIARPERARFGPGAMTGLAATASGLLVGVTLALGLFVDATASSSRAQNRAMRAAAQGDAAIAGPPSVHLHIGTCVWLSVAAAGCAIAGLSVGLWRRPARESPGDGAPPVLASPGEADADDADVLD